MGGGPPLVIGLKIILSLTSISKLPVPNNNFWDNEIWDNEILSLRAGICVVFSFKKSMEFCPYYYLRIFY